MVTRDAVCLATDIFPDEVGKKKCLLVHLGGYLFSVAQGHLHMATVTQIFDVVIMSSDMGCIVTNVTVRT